MTARLRGAAVGAGYFSRFHCDAWRRIPAVEIRALCDREPGRAAAVAGEFGIPKRYTDLRRMLDEERPDFLDVITPPETHLQICQETAERGIRVICQKPLAPTFREAKEIVRLSSAAGIRFMVHENFRFQPWHREIKRLLQAGAIGAKLHSLAFRSRPGDGWGPDAYLSRQP